MNENSKNVNLANLANTLNSMASSLCSYISTLGDDAVVNGGIIAVCDVQMESVRAVGTLVQQALDGYV